ncbi:MAG: hypothetical protein ACLQHK_02945 [Gallionellaceae bacterium]
MNIKLVQAFVMVLCLYSSQSGAVEPGFGNPTAAEIAALPAYCQSRYGGSGDAHFKYWYDTMGPIFEHVHHYCMAQVSLSRYYRTDNPVDRGFFLGEAIHNLNYMTGITAPAVQSSALMPEIYLTKGRVLLLAHSDAEAATAFLHAIELKPDYADPYAAMADFYVRIKNKRDALKILQEGLRQIPTSRSLARRYQELGGKLPLADAPIAVTEVSKSEPQSSVPVETEKGAVQATPVTIPQTSSPEQTTRSERPLEKTGSPSNPWCRFCADDESAPAMK